jgi:deoxyhypusine synthase
MMTEFDYLKASYTAALQQGLQGLINASYHDVKLANAWIHKFCEIMVENSNYTDAEKMAMKQELEVLKEMHDKEIEEFHSHQF